MPGGLHEVRLRGRCYNPHWIAALFSALSQSCVSIVSGDALRDKQKEWAIRLALDFRRSPHKPEDLNYAEMTKLRLPTQATAMPQLSHFAISRRTDEGLEVLLAGPDQMGFLGRVLVKASALGLYPTELEIKTVGGLIRDRVVLRGIGGGAPDGDAEIALQALLNRFVKPAGAQAALLKSLRPAGAPAS
jgi:hypothetical protein